MNNEKITITTVINADIKKVWEYWNEPKHIVNWAFASDDWECLYSTNELRVGGKFITTMSAKDKNVSFDFNGTYDEVVQFSKIKYTMEKILKEEVPRVCETVFDNVSENQTKITQKFDSENENPVDMQKSGWQAILNNFKKYIELSNIVHN